MNSDKQSVLLKKTTDLLVGTHDFRHLAREAVTLVLKELKDQNLIGAAIFRVHQSEHSLYAYTYANQYHKLIDVLLPAKFSQLNVSLSESGNLLVKAVLTNKIQQNANLFGFGRGALTETVCKGIEKVVKVKLWISLPIRLKSGKVAGVILLAISDSKLSGEQLVLFETFASQLGLAFSNILEFERLMAKYNNLTSRFLSSEDDALSVKFTLRVTPKENEKLEWLAREKKRTKAEIIRDFLDKE